MDECKPLPVSASWPPVREPKARPRPLLVRTLGVTLLQGLTLVHFSAQLERFVWDRGCA